jgi:Pumilio-family RNA binding repeat
MMKNKYGNYVINKSIAHADHEDKQAIIIAISRCVNSINVSKYRTRWIQFLEEMNSSKQLNAGQMVKASIFRQGSGMSADSESSRKYSDNENEPNEDSPGQSKREFDRNQLSKFYYQTSVGKGSNDSIGSGASPTVGSNKYGGGANMKPKGNQNQNSHGNSNSSGSPKKGKGHQNQNQKYYVEKSNKNSYYNS